MGTMVNATNSEAKSEMITETDRLWAMRPAMPVANIMGKKTATVVRVEAAMAMPTSEVPLRAASVGLSPSCRWRKMFSMTTTALSTSMPTPSARPPRVIRFRV